MKVPLLQIVERYRLGNQQAEGAKVVVVAVAVVAVVAVAVVVVVRAVVEEVVG